MIIRRHIFLAAAIVMFASPVTAQIDSPPSAPARFDVDAFIRSIGDRVDHTKALTHTLETYRRACHGAHNQQLVDLTENLLVELFPRLGRAVRAMRENAPGAALLLADLAGDELAEPRVRTFATFRLGQLLLDSELPKQAVEILVTVNTDRTMTPVVPSTAFYVADALYRIPNLPAAHEAFRMFLANHPDAPPKLRTIARQRLQSIATRSTNPVHAVADDMLRVRRALAAGRSGPAVQSVQAKIEDQLRGLIAELEKEQQKQSSSSNQEQQPSGSASNPGTRAPTPGGGATPTNLGQTIIRAGRWGAMTPEEREAILSTIEESMPGTYRQWLRAYYRSLSETQRR